MGLKDAGRMTSPPVVTVRYDARSQTLSAHPRRLDLGDSTDTLTWLFSGLPNELVPRVLFPSHRDAPGHFGPFASIRCDAFRAFGQGRSHQGGRYEYVAEVVNGVHGDTVARLDGLEIRTRGAAADPSPEIVVSRQAGGEIIVEPRRAQVFRDQTVVWRFVGFDLRRWMPYLRFTGAPPHLVNPYFGPFQSLGVHAGMVVGNHANGAPGRYTYEVGVRHPATGAPHECVIVDPGLDSNGDPPGG